MDKHTPATHTLFGSQGSGSAAVEVALQLCDLPYRSMRASSWEADSAIEELAAVNPMRQIPTLVLPDGSVMTESAAILIHLGMTHPHSGLLPADASARAQAIRGLVFIAANCYAALSINDYPARWTTATTKPAQEKVRQGARAQLHRHWAIFCRRLCGPALPQRGGAGCAGHTGCRGQQMGRHPCLPAPAPAGVCRPAASHRSP